MTFLSGWIKDDPAGDHKDLVLPKLRVVGAAGPKGRALFKPRARTQRRSNFCVDFAICAAQSHAEVRAGRPYVELSPLFNGYLARTPAERPRNVGTQIRLGLDAARRFGTASEDAHPMELVSPDDYIDRMAVVPPVEAYTEAANHQVLANFRVADGDVSGIDNVIDAGLGVVVGIPWREGNADADKNGIIVDPKDGGDTLGFHAIYVYDRAVIEGVRRYWFLNSHDVGFGIDGYGWLTAKHLEEAEDNWVVATTELVVANAA